MATDVGWMLTVNPYGKQLVTSSWTSNFVKIWDPETDSMVANFEKFNKPTNAIALGKDIVFSELGGAIKRFSPAAPEKATTLAEGLKQPFGLAYDNGDLYVSEDLGGRIVQIMDNDKVITPKVVKEGLNSPQGLAIANGHLYVVEAGEGRLLSIDLSSGDTKTVAYGMKFSTGKLKFTDTTNWARSSIAISGKTAYIGGAGAGSIYKINL
jgi:WD40 repeat protein